MHAGGQCHFLFHCASYLHLQVVWSAPFSSGGIANPAKPIFSNGRGPLPSLRALAWAVEDCSRQPLLAVSKLLSHSPGPESESRRPKLKFNRGP